MQSTANQDIGIISTLYNCDTDIERDSETALLMDHLGIIQMRRFVFHSRGY